MKTSAQLVAFSLVSVLAACGGGGGGGGAGGGGGGGGGGAAGTSYLFYAGSMHAVDPANPSAPVTVEPADDIVEGPFGAETSARIFQGGSYDATTKRVSNLQSRVLMYAKTDGKFYRVDALKSGSLTPVQVSNESQADRMCLQPPSFTTPSDYANLTDSPYVYALPGSDGLCETSDDQWKVIRLGMSSASAPIAAKLPVLPLHAPTNGAVAAWLVHDGGALKKCNANFAACGAALVSASNTPLALLGLSLNKALLNVDDRLFVYDGDTDTLSPAIFTVPAGTVVRASAADATHIFFAHERSIYRAPIDGSAAATVIAAEANDTSFQMSVTQNKLVYMTGGIGLGMQLKALDKAGGVSSTLADAPSGNFGILFVNGNLIYYSFTAQVASGAGFSVVPLLAGNVDELGGGKSETANAAWAGALSATTLDAGKSGTLALPSQYMIRAEGWDANGAGTGFAGATLRAFDAATAAALAVVGTLPVAEKYPGISCFGVEANVLCNATIELSPPPALPALPFQLDVFFLNATTASSLTRVTNTPSENELPAIL